MNILIKHATLVHRAHPLHEQLVDIWIKDGMIAKIAQEVNAPDAQEIHFPGLHVSAGWIDLKARFGDPGYEHRETIESGLNAAAAGGFTKVLMMPGTYPAISSKSQVEYALSKGKDHITTLLIAGSMSRDMEGKDLSEMYDMYCSGAVAFTDDKSFVSAGLLSRAMLYTRTMDCRLLVYPCEEGFFHDGQVNEGEASTFTGLRGIPGIAEAAGISRNLYLSAYNHRGLHFSNISTAQSIALIEQAQRMGTDISASTSWTNLCFNETSVIGFDSEYKVYPPLRSETDRKALIQGVKKGTIMAISSDHTPWEIEMKEREFDDAAFGVRGLESLFGAVRTFAPELTVEEIVASLTSGPAAALGIEATSIEEGIQAELTLFCPDEKWTFSPSDVSYGYANSPLINKELTGKVKGIIGNGQSRLFI